MGANNSGIACGYLDIAPRFSGNYNSVGNMLSAIAGILGPMVVAALLQAYGPDMGWSFSFLLTAGLSIIALGFWVVFQSSDINHKLNNPEC
jgi:MFS family permease